MSACKRTIRVRVFNANSFAKKAVTYGRLVVYDDIDESMTLGELVNRVIGDDGGGEPFSLAVNGQHFGGNLRAKLVTLLNDDDDDNKVHVHLFTGTRDWRVDVSALEESKENGERRRLYVKVASADAEPISIAYSCSMLLRQVRLIVADALGASQEHRRFIFAGRVLRDDWTTLAVNSLQFDSTLLLV
jgi:hypothetical protein